MDLFGELEPMLFHAKQGELEGPSDVTTPENIYTYIANH